MKVFTADKIRTADAYTIANEPISSVDLMERAANAIALWIKKKYQTDILLKVFVGPGNNGGDGWALARLLFNRGYLNIEVFQLKLEKNISIDAEINRKRLVGETQVKVVEIRSQEEFPVLNDSDYIVDALFGSGLSRPLDGITADLVNYINESQKSCVMAVDIPSGLFSEDNSKNNFKNIIKADYTLSFQFPKVAFFFAENEKCVGEWHVLPIGLHPSYIENEPTIYNYLQEDEVASLLKKRDKFGHKGTYGHALLIAGNYGMMGAALLAAKSALKAGAGLVTTHVPRLGLEILQSYLPESLTSIDKSDLIFTECNIDKKYTAIGVGPAIGRQGQTKEALIKLLKTSTMPLVIDADAINILSDIENFEEIIPEGTILTPHLKEFERLFGGFSDSFSRLMFQIEFSKRKRCTIVLKGAYTCITLPSGDVYFNSTGNPGMATGGSGDVLTGIILGLLAQGYSSELSAIIGVYVHGMAGDIYSKSKSQYSLIASDLIDNIGSAFNVLEKMKLEK